METNEFRNTAALVHLSTLTQYFIPLGNYIFPIVIWSSYKEKSEFVDHHGKQAINFQLSLLLYSLILLIISVPILIINVFHHIPVTDLFHHHNITFDSLDFTSHIGAISIAIMGILLVALIKAFEFFLIIYASIKASNGEYYRYPMTINFIK